MGKRSDLERQGCVIIDDYDDDVRHMSTINLNVGCVPGANIENIFPECCNLAARLGAAWINFKFNDLSGTAYPNNRGFLVDTGAHMVGTWDALNGFQWNDGRNHNSIRQSNS